MKNKSVVAWTTLLTGLWPLQQVQCAGLPLEELPTSISTRFDNIRLPGHERLGLLNAAYLVQAGTHDWLGPAVTGAATGQRGGLFVLGGQWEHRWRLGDRWRAQTGLFAGGGGGAAAPVGSGLMLQPSISLLRQWGGWHAGVSASRVLFTDGRIHSNQLGLIVQWDGATRYFRAGQIGNELGSSTERTGLGVDRVAPTWSRYTFKTPTGSHPSISLIGIRAEQDWDNGFYGGLESAAATHGGADGYMEILGLAGWATRPAPSQLPGLHLGAKAALGLGGGGAVPTGGGGIGKLAGTLRWDIGSQAFVGAEAGWANSLRARPASGPFQARYAQVFAGWTLGGAAAPANATVNGMDWSASLQHVARAKRKDGSVQSLDTMGIKANYWQGPHWYLTGQAHSAFAGHAGAYSVGLFGVGWTHRPGENYWANPFTVGAEAMVGAAGGGGVDTRGGAIAQGLLSVGYQLSRRSQFQIGIGQVKSFKPGGLNSPVLDISWTMTLGVGR
ncbi:MAG: hypothetical protein ACM3VZ_11985 [Acidobacteriota bacterium]